VISKPGHRSGRALKSDRRFPPQAQQQRTSPCQRGNPVQTEAVAVSNFTLSSEERHTCRVGSIEHKSSPAAGGLGFPSLRRSSSG
jgi:hypothetical protein